MPRKKKNNWKILNRKIHYWGSIICALPILIILITGLLLLFKKELDWIQPPSTKGQGTIPTIAFERILQVAKKVDEANIKNWDDVDRLDVRPSKGIIKIRAKNKYEIQIDQQTGKILQTAYRRSDLIEDIHTGNFFHKYVSLGLFFPAALILLVLWITGIYLFITMLSNKKKIKRQKKIINHK